MKILLTLFGAAALALSMAACVPSAHQETAVDSSAATQQTTAAVTTAPAEEFQPLVLVDNEDITFTVTAIEDDPLWGYTLKVYLENKTDKQLMFSAGNVSVNGFMCDPYWAQTVDAGKRSNTGISWFGSDFEENGIDAVTDITFTLRVYDSSDWLAEDIFTDTFTVNP